MLKNPLTYEIMTPQSVGLSGQHAVGRQAVRPSRAAGQAARARLRARGRGARRGLPRGDRAGRRQEGGHRRRPGRARRAAATADVRRARSSVARRLERQLVARRPLGRERVARRRWRGEGRGRHRQRARGRAVRRGRRGRRAAARLAPGADRVRDPRRLWRRGRPGAGAGARRRSPTRDLAPSGNRPRALDEHHRGVPRGLPRRRSNKLHGAEINGIEVAFVGRRVAEELP